jgi:acetyl esterase/lipase
MRSASSCGKPAFVGRLTRRLVPGLILLLLRGTTGAQEPAALVSWAEINRPAPPADVRVAYGPDPEMFGDLRLPAGPGPHPVMVVLHGGCWRAENDLVHISHLSEALRDLDLATWTVEYRRVGNPGGGWPGTFQDIVAGANHLVDIAEDFELDLDRVFLLGHSAGGHLALWLATQAAAPAGLIDAPPLRIGFRSLIGLAGIADLRTFSEGDRYCNRAVAPLVGGTPEEVPDRYAAVDPMARPAPELPVLFIHGALDSHVPVAQPESYQRRAEALDQRVRLHLLADAGHFDLIAPFSRAWPTVRDLIEAALAEVLESPGSPGSQRADPSYRPAIAQPTYARGAGPVVWVDEAHHNIVTTTGRYRPFAASLEADGYVVRPFREEFSVASFEDVDVLVIGNPLHPRNLDDWSLPAPSAFTPLEVRAVFEWVNRGGALLLLVDHMPFPGAAGELAHAFGLEFLNGYVEDPKTWEPIVFRRAEGSLVAHPVTDGESASDRVDAVATFDGSAFRADAAQPLLVLGPRHLSFHPERSWDIDDSTPTRPVDGWLQGAVMEVGMGRLAVFADATMFSAQIGAPARPKLGMNTPEGAGNLQLLRNVLRWLTTHRMIP